VPVSVARQQRRAVRTLSGRELSLIRCIDDSGVRALTQLRSRVTAICILYYARSHEAMEEEHKSTSSFQALAAIEQYTPPLIPRDSGASQVSQQFRYLDAAGDQRTPFALHVVTPVLDPETS
jgi:hypothetical protein